MTVAWFSYFPVERLPDVPEVIRRLPPEHPASWQQVLLGELERNPGIRLHVVALRKRLERSATFQRNGVTFHCLKPPPFMRAPSFFWIDTLMIRRVLRQIRPDVVHAWGTEQGAALVASRLPYPALVTMQGLLSWLAEMFPLNGYQRFAAALERLSLRRASVVTAESAFAVRYLERHFQNLDVRQIEHAPLPMFFRVERRPQLKPLRFVWIGWFGQPKGADVLMRALDRLRLELDFELVLIGPVDDSFLRKVKSATSPELWLKVRFRDRLTAEAIAGELAIATLMIFPTRGDNSPNVVKEAVVAGVPVVATNIGGIPDYVIPERNGLLFPKEDVDGCCQAIRTACHHPLFSQGRVDAVTLSRTRDYLSPARMGENFFETYREVCGQSR